MLSRRQILAGTAAGAALPLVPARVAAQSAAMESAAPRLVEAQRFPVGDTYVTALSDGSIRLGPEALQGVDQDAYDRLMTRAFIPHPDRYVSGINAFLIERGDELMLVDAGTGGSMNAGAGRTVEQLRGLGIDPASISRLVMTHLHPDHVGGAVMDGAATFPNATMVVNEAERAYWSDDSNAAQGSPDFFRLAQAALELYGDRIEEFSEEGEVAPGLTAMPLPGHTPGHTGYMVSDGDEQLLIWADIVHVAPVQLAQPYVTIGFDVNPEQAIETRRSILDRVTSDGVQIASSHIPFPGIGFITSAEDEGYRFVASPYPYTA